MLSFRCRLRAVTHVCSATGEIGEHALLSSRLCQGERDATFSVIHFI